MDTSFSHNRIQWKLISTISVGDCVTYEYECDPESYYSDSRKYHLTKVVSPDGEHHTYSVR